MKAIKIENKFPYFEIFQTVFSYHFNFLIGLSLIILFYNLVFVVTNDANLNYELFVRLSGGLIGCSVFYLAIVSLISIFIVNNKYQVEITSGKLLDRYLNSKTEIKISSIPKFYNVRITPNTIQIISKLPTRGTRKTSRLITNSIFVFAPNKSRQRDFLLKALNA